MMGKKRHAQERTARSDRAISASRSPAPVIWSARARSRSSMTETTSLVVNAMARAKNPVAGRRTGHILWRACRSQRWNTGRAHSLTYRKGCGAGWSRPRRCKRRDSPGADFHGFPGVPVQGQEGKPGLEGPLCQRKGAHETAQALETVGHGYHLPVGEVPERFGEKGNRGSAGALPLLERCSMRKGGRRPSRCGASGLQRSRG